MIVFIVHTARRLKILYRLNENLIKAHNNRMQPDFGELALASAADAGRYVERIWCICTVEDEIVMA